MAKIDSLHIPSEQKKNILRNTWEVLSDRPKQILAVVFSAILLSGGLGFKANQIKTSSDIQVALSASSTVPKKGRSPLGLEQAILKECSEKSSSFIDEMTLICQKNSALFLGALIREISAHPENTELYKLDPLFAEAQYSDLSEEGKRLIAVLAQNTFFESSGKGNMPNLQKIISSAPKNPVTQRVSDFINPKESFENTVNSTSKGLVSVVKQTGEFETKNAERIHAEYVNYAAREVLKELETYKKVLHTLSLDTSVIDVAISGIDRKKLDDKNPLSDIPFSECIRLIGMQNNWPHICANIQDQVSTKILSYAQSSIELREAEGDMSDTSKKEAVKEETRLFKSIQKILASNNQWLIGEVFEKIPERYKGLTPDDIVIAKKYQVTPRSHSEYTELKKKIEEEIVVGDVRIKKFTLINEANLTAKNLARALARSPYKENVEWILADISGKGGGVFQEMLKKYYENMKPRKKV